jgi:hypothetical protein
LRTRAETPTRWLLRVVSVVVGACAVSLLYGFLTTNIWHDGLWTAWTGRGVRQYVLFLTAAALLASVNALLGRRRWPLALALVGFVVVADGAIALAAVALLGATALVVGAVVRGSEGEPGVESALLDLVVGLAVLLGVVQILVHFPVNTRALYVVMLLAPAALGWRVVRDRVLQLAAPFARRPARTFEYWAEAALATVLLAHAVVASIPVPGSDALAMHLMVPHQVASTHLWAFDFHSYVWALVPMGASWLFTAANFLGGEAAARLSNLGLLLMVVLLVLGELRRRVPPAVATLVAAVTAAAPIVFQESISLWAENLLSAFLVSAALLLPRFWREPTTRGFCALMLCAGGALMTKSLGVLVLPLMVLAFFRLAGAPMRPRRKVAAALLGGSLFLLTGCVPYLFALVRTGNPLFPYFNQIFQSPAYQGEFVDDTWVGHGGVDCLFQMTFRSATYCELYDGAFGFQHLLLLPAGLLVALACWRWPARAGLLGIMLVVAGLFWKMQYLRYLYPAMWGAAVVEGEAVGILLRTTPTRRRAAVTAVAGLLIGNLVFLATGYYLLRDFPIHVALSENERELFLRQEVTIRGINETINELAGSRARVLYLSEPFGAFLEGMPIYSNWYNPSLAARMEATSEPGQMRQLLADLSISHVVVQDIPDYAEARHLVLASGCRLRLRVNVYELYEVGAK